MPGPLSFGEDPETFIRRLANNIIETEAEGRINGTHLMHGLGALDDMAKIFAMLQVYHIPCDDFRVEMGGIVRLFSDCLLTGNIEDYNKFREESLKFVAIWNPKTDERVRKTILENAETPKEQQTCANCSLNTYCMVQTGYCGGWQRG